MKFEELALNEKILEAISYMGFEKASPIQEQAIPEILKGNDLIACAQTGTGKTAAFILPVLNKLYENKTDKTKVLVICPTRELALQIDQQIQGFAYFLDINSIPIYGGGDGDNWELQKKALTLGTEIIVATPGKLISHLNLGYVNFNELEYLILDEADRMLDMGFIDDIKKIIDYLPKKRQTLMFSATMAPKIKNLAKESLVNPIEISLALAKPAEGVLQATYLVYEQQKTALIHTLINNKPEYESIIIFSSTKKKVSDIVRSLKKENYEVEGISSDFEQKQREEVLARFAAKKIRIIVGTDVISRGIDIKDINLVINYDVPGDAADYVHRVGRTARANTTGVALTLINENDMEKFNRIEQLIEREIIKLPAPTELGVSPEWKLPEKRRKFKRRS